MSFRDFNDEGPGTFEWDFVLGGNTTGLFPEETQKYSHSTRAAAPCPGIPSCNQHKTYMQFLQNRR